MARIKKMADGGITSLGTLAASAAPPSSGNFSASSTGGDFGLTGGGSGAMSGGTASDGLGQINQGAGTVANAISQANSALGSSQGTPYKKGGKVSLSDCKVTTHHKNKSSPNW